MSCGVNYDMWRGKSDEALLAILDELDQAIAAAEDQAKELREVNSHV